MTEIIDRTNEKYGRLIALKHVGFTENGGATWLCRCDCGNEVIIRGGCLARGSTKSCGCLHRDLSRIRLAKLDKRTNVTHGMSKAPEYKAWIQMRRRCLDPKTTQYPRYGGRGITIAAEWLNDFPAFLSHVGQKPTARHSLDRLDTNGNYEPGNVRWATPKEQANNRRSNVIVIVGGRPMTIAEAARTLGVTNRVMEHRVKKAAILSDGPLNVP